MNSYYFDNCNYLQDERGANLFCRRKKPKIGSGTTNNGISLRFTTCSAANFVFRNNTLSKRYRELFVMSHGHAQFLLFAFAYV